MTAPALIAAMRKAIAAPDVVLAAAAIDPDRSAIEVTPASTDPRARFEIGSITKTMTATLLALLVDEGKLSLDDQIGRWLAAGDNSAITVAQLATHTSGLPSMGPGMRERRSRNPENPWGGYDFAEAEKDLARVSAKVSSWTYSNLGYQLLALVLERASALPYQQLLTERLLEPLGMTDSRVGHGDDRLLLEGRGGEGPVGHRGHPLGAGGVEATIGDLARYARACLFPPSTPLGEAIRRAQTPLVRTGPETEQALGWLVRGGAVREHSGGTAGFTACISLNPVRGRAVALLASYGGSIALASHLKNAGMLVLADRDPSTVETPTPFPGWRETVLDVVGLLLAGDLQRVHENFAPARREKTSPEMLATAWRRATAEAGSVDAGPAEAADIRIQRSESTATGAVVVDVEIAFPARVQVVRVGVLPDGSIGGLALLPSGHA